MYSLDKLDFKYLILLDACNDFDFEIVYNANWASKLTGALRVGDSGATCTIEWYKLHVKHGRPNMALISSSPVPFHKHTDYAANKFGRAIKAWGTIDDVDPQRAFDRLEEVKEYQKVIIHLIPPHLPFLGTEGKAFMLEHGLVKGGILSYPHLQTWAQKGPNRFKRLRELYRENLDVALQAVWENLHLMDDGKIIISSDHGELIGYDGKYDHPCTKAEGPQQVKLRAVPVLEVDEEALINRRLEYLGYV